MHDFTHFAHLIEFIAALNGAYILSTEFAKKVKKLTNYAGSKVITEHKLVNIKWKSARGLMFKLINGATEDLTKLCEEFNDTCKQIKLRIESVRKEYIENSTNFEELTNFNIFCFFGAFYSVIVLILIGAEYKFDQDFTRDYFFLFNIISFIIIIIFKFRGFKEKYIHVLWLIIPPALITGVLMLFNVWEKIGICNTNWLYVGNCILALIIPTWHFLFYIIKSKKRIEKIDNDFLLEVQNCSSQCDTFTIALNKALKGEKTKGQSPTDLEEKSVPLIVVGRILYIAASEEQWKVYWENETLGTYFSTKIDAIKYSREEVSKLQEGSVLQIRINNSDGTFAVEWTYGIDDFPPLIAEQ